MTNNLAKILKSPYPDRGKLLKEIGVDGFSNKEIDYMSKVVFKIHIVAENKHFLKVLRTKGMSSKEYKFKKLVEALTI